MLNKSFVMTYDRMWLKERYDFLATKMRILKDKLCPSYMQRLRIKRANILAEIASLQAQLENTDSQIENYSSEQISLDLIKCDIEKRIVRTRLDNSYYSEESPESQAKRLYKEIY